jgi:hypothetical protein
MKFLLVCVILLAPAASWARYNGQKVTDARTTEYYADKPEYHWCGKAACKTTEEMNTHQQ